MARPRKSRRVCSLPRNSSFAPLLQGQRNEEVHMTVDEYETIRLIDLAGYNQEECADQMHIARTTVQGIYIDARRKLADALVNGKTLLIAGGDVAFCDGSSVPCGRKCQKFCCRQEASPEAEEMTLDE